MNSTEKKPVILIVDDDTRNVNLLVKCLTGKYDVKVANSGWQALDIADTESQLDLILLDVHMPEIDGFEVCKRLKQKSRTHDIPVIFITADHDEANERLGLELGAVDYITKPFPVAITQARIYNHIHLRKEIAQRKLASDALQVAGLIYNNVSDGLILTDSNNNIIAINSVFTETTGYTLDEVFGKSPAILCSGRQDRAFYETMWNALRTTGTWQGELINRRKNGEEYVESLRINTLYHADGTVRLYVGLFSDITLHKQTEELLWRQANFDSLTGLCNRQMFREHLSAKFKEAHRTGNPLALMLLDIDQFREVNESLGYPLGNALLQAVAERLQQQLRETDVLARLGGDEFAIVFDELDDSLDIEVITQAILDELTEPFVLNDENIYVSVSIGIAIYPDDAQVIDDLMKNADQSMYAAKQQGRNSYRFFKPEMQERAQHKRRLTSDLRVALLRKQFEVYYQPIVALPNHEVVKAEALIRWRHPERGVVSPAEFVPLAEETGLIREIGDWVFYEAAQQLAYWRAQYSVDLQVSINKSPVQFTDNPEGHTDWFAYLKAINLPEQSIVVEITEGLMLDASSKITDQLLAFRDAGIQVAIDDFGTGYSALSYLKKFDIDYLKIDKSFTNGLASDSEDLALCEAIVMMAHKLGLKVIAEGVETQVQNDLLVAIGCDFGQGYFYARPMPVAAFGDLLALKTQAKREVVCE